MLFPYPPGDPARGLTEETAMNNIQTLVSGAASLLMAAALALVLLAIADRNGSDAEQAITAQGPVGTTSLF